MDGRLEVAASGVIPTVRGIKVGPPRPVVTDIRTFETQSSFLLAWQQAAYYRQAVGAFAAVIDDGGILAPNVLICDCRVRVQAGTAGIGATVETLWKLMPSLDYGDYISVITAGVVDLSAFTRLQQAAWAVSASTTISVGTIGFTTATGDLQWPIYEAQRIAVKEAARALAGDDAAIQPSLSGGQLVTTIEVSSEQACFNLMAQCRALVGTYQNVNLGGIQVSGVAIMDCHSSWSRVVGSPNSKTHLFTCTWDMDLQEESTGNDTRCCSLVQVASTWGTWNTVQYAVCEEADEGVNASVGQVTWKLDLGKTLRARIPTQSEPTDYTGKWCRILARYRNGTPGVVTTLPSGCVPDPNGLTLFPMWHGEVLEQHIDSGSQAVSATMANICAGIMACWEKVYFDHWYEVGKDFGMADPGEVLPFNGVPGGDGGGTGTGEVNTDFVHARKRDRWDGSKWVTDLRRWTAYEIVHLIISAVGAQFPQGPKWVLGGLTDSLKFSGDWDLRKKNALEMLAEIVSPRWGLSFRPEVLDGTVTIRINTTVQVATTVPGIGTLPANDRQAAKDASTKSIIRASLRRSAHAQADRILCEAGRGWGMTTFGVGKIGAVNPPVKSLDMVPAWDESQEATWLAASKEQRNSDALKDVYRRFILKSDYAGTTFNNHTTNIILEMTRILDANGGEVGMAAADDGFTTGGVLPYGDNLRFTRKLPFSQGVDWAALSGTGAVVDLAPHGLRQPEGPLVFGLRVSAGTFVYFDFTSKWDVQVEDHAPAITLGRDADDAKEIKDWLSSNGYLLFTVGIEAALPWRVSYRRTQASRARDMERSQMLWFPEIVYRRCFINTILGLTNQLTPKTNVADIRMDWQTPVAAGGGAVVGRLDATLSLAKLWHLDTWKTLAYEERGILDGSTVTAPGSMVTTGTIRLDAQRTLVETCNAIYTGRSWDFRVDSVGTRINTDRLLPGFDHFTMAKTVPRMALNLNQNYQLGVGLK